MVEKIDDAINAAMESGLDIEEIVLSTCEWNALRDSLKRLHLYGAIMSCCSIKDGKRSVKFRGVPVVWYVR
jgi:hypothetical protein